MINTYVDLLILAFAVVYAIDVSGFVPEIITRFFRWLKKPRPTQTVKPWECSLCMTFWTGVVYLLITGFTLPAFLYVIALSAFSTTIKDIFILTRDILTKIIDTIYYWLSL